MINYDPTAYVPNYVGLGQGINQAVAGLASGIGQIAEIKGNQRQADTTQKDELLKRYNQLRSFAKDKDGIDMPEDKAATGVGYEMLIDEYAKYASQSTGVAYEKAKDDLSRIFVCPAMKIETKEDLEKFKASLEGQAGAATKYLENIGAYKDRAKIVDSELAGIGRSVDPREFGPVMEQPNGPMPKIDDYSNSIAQLNNYKETGNAQMLNDAQSGIGGINKSYATARQNVADTQAIANAQGINPQVQTAVVGARNSGASDSTANWIGSQVEKTQSQLDKEVADANSDKTDKLDVRYQRRLTYLEGRRKEFEGQLVKLVGQYVKPDGGKMFKSVDEFVTSPQVPSEVKAQYETLSAAIEAVEDTKSVVDQWYEANQDSAARGNISQLDPANKLLDNAMTKPQYLDKIRKNIFDSVNKKFKEGGYKSAGKSREAEQQEAIKASGGSASVKALPSGGFLGMGRNIGELQYNGAVAQSDPDKAPQPAFTPAANDETLRGPQAPVAGRKNTNQQPVQKPAPNIVAMYKRAANEPNNPDRAAAIAALNSWGESY